MATPIFLVGSVHVASGSLGNPNPVALAVTLELALGRVRGVNSAKATGTIPAAGGVGPGSLAFSLNMTMPILTAIYPVTAWIDYGDMTVTYDGGQVQVYAILPPTIEVTF